MSKHTTYILIAIIGISGLLHLTGLFNNGEADLYIGLTLTGLATLSFGRNFFVNGMSFATRNILVIKKKEIKWWRILDIQAVAVMTYLLIYKDEFESVLITLILYSSLNIIFDHRRTIIISDKYIYIDGATLSFDSIHSMEIQPSHVFVSVNNDSINEHVIDLTNVTPNDRVLILKELARWKSTAANNVFASSGVDA